MKIKFILFFILLIFNIKNGFSRSIIVIDEPNRPRSEKEALLILPGFGSKLHGSKHQRRFFAHQGYDLFIPDYISRKSVKNTVESLDHFIRKHHLSEYKKVHVFGYIVGSWVINSWMQQHPGHNIATVVYDRSPLQERAPATMVRDRPGLMYLYAGPIMKDFCVTPYPILDTAGIRAGILIESKATKLIRRHRQTALSLGPVSWDPADLHQPAQDVLYTWLNHDDMYSRFDIIGTEVLLFIRTGKFSAQARRAPYTDDPFTPYQAQ